MLLEIKRAVKSNVNIQLSAEEKKAINITNDIITKIYKLVQEEANLDFLDFFNICWALYLSFIF